MMEKIRFDNGGCVIEWHIENPSCLKPSNYTLSPVFTIDTNTKTQWMFQLYKFDDCNLNLWLHRCDTNSSSVTISYACFSKTDYKEMGKTTGLLTFEKLSNECINSSNFIDIDINFPKYLTIHCYLRFIEDINLVTHHYTFRSVVEAENIKFKYSIPNISKWKLKQKLSISLPSRCNEPEHFEIKLSSPASKSDDLMHACLEFFGIKQDVNNGVYLRCKLAVLDGENTTVLTATHDHEFAKVNEKWLFPNNINIMTMVQNCMKDVLTLDFDLLISEHKVTTWMETLTTLSNLQVKMASDSLEKEKVNLNDDFMCLYIERKCPDVEVCAEGKKFPAHKAILSARSPVFMAMFENNMQEREKNVVEISDLDSETVDRMLFFMYSEIVQIQEWDKVTKLYVASDKYQIMTLKDKCSSILKGQLSLKNVCEALHLADMHSDSDLLQTVQDFVVANDEKVLNSKEWKEFMNSNSTTACQTMHKAWQHRSKKP